jgi:hypothetical protein
MTRQSFTTSLLNLSLVATIALGTAGLAFAQDPVEQDENAPDPTELARQIRRNMLKIEDDLAKAGTHDPARGEQVKKDLEKLLDSMKQRGDQVVKDIDEIVKQIKLGNCNSGSEGQSDSNQNQKQSRARDRTKPQGQGKPRDPNQAQKPGGKPKPKDGKEQGKNNKKGGAEDNTRKAEDPGENQTGDPRNDPKAEKVARINLNEIWGNLPPELRQKLIDRNYDEFTPEYQEQIQEYFRKTSSTPKK